MNVTGIKRASDWPFPMPGYLADDIDKLVDAMARDDEFLDCYQDNVEGAARSVSEEHDKQIYDYYLKGGWHADVVD